MLGSEIHKYSISYQDYQIIYTNREVEIGKYSNIYQYLSQFETKLSQKRETKQVTLPYWCLHWPRYRKLFIEDKIIIRQTADKIISTFDNQGYLF